MDGKVVVTVMGADKTGIVAGVSAKLNELDINIIDISQTIFENEILSKNSEKFWNLSSLKQIN